MCGRRILDRVRHAGGLRLANAGRYAQLLSTSARSSGAAPQPHPAGSGAKPRQKLAARHSMDHAGFYSERGPAGARAENVAWGCGTENCAVRIWEELSGHRANMLLADVKNYGIASATGGGSRYWCLVLGR